MSSASGTGADLTVEGLSLKETGKLEKGFNSGSDSVKLGLLGVTLTG